MLQLLGKPRSLGSVSTVGPENAGLHRTLPAP